DARHLADAAGQVGDVPDAEPDGHRAEGPVPEGQPERVGDAQPYGRVPLAHLRDAEPDHRLAEVRSDHAAGWPDGAAELHREVRRPRADVQDEVPRPDARRLDGRATPALVLV